MASIEEKWRPAESLHRALAIAAATTFFALTLLAFTPAHADSGGLSEEDQNCLACHGNDTFKKDLADGTKLSLHVSAKDFAGSVHAPLGCTGCHADVDPDEHPGKPRDIKSARAFSLAMVEVCQPCHSEVFKRQAKSVHAALLRQGVSQAPVCTDCHGSHAITRGTAYNACASCHARTMVEHRNWLPNARLHLEVVACAACHASGAKRMVDLRLYDATAKTWVVEPHGAPDFEQVARSVDADGNGLDATELRALMARIAPSGAPSRFVLRGRVDLQHPVESHELVDPAHAIKQCASCHRRGAEPFQNVNVSVVGENGKLLRYKAQKDVLSSALSVGSLREFYAVGGTRNVLFDALLLLAVVGGVSVPVGHQALKWFVRRRLRSAAEASAQSEEPGRPSSGDGPDGDGTSR